MRKATERKRGRRRGRMDEEVLYRGRPMTAREACRLAGVKPYTYIGRRYQLAWPPERWFGKGDGRRTGGGVRPAAYRQAIRPGSPANALARTRSFGTDARGVPLTRTMAVPPCACGRGAAPPLCRACGGAVPTEAEAPHLDALLRLSPIPLGTAVAAARKPHRLTRRALATDAGLDLTYLRHVEIGRVRAVPLGHLRAIAEALRVPLDRLLEAGAAPAVTSRGGGRPPRAAAAPAPASSGPPRRPRPPPAARPASGTPAAAG